MPSNGDDGDGDGDGAAPPGSSSPSPSSSSPSAEDPAVGAAPSPPKLKLPNPYIPERRSYISRGSAPDDGGDSPPSTAAAGRYGTSVSAIRGSRSG